MVHSQASTFNPIALGLENPDIRSDRTVSISRKGVTRKTPPGCFDGWCHPGVGPRGGSLDPPEHPGGSAIWVDGRYELVFWLGLNVTKSFSMYLSGGMICSRLGHDVVPIKVCTWEEERVKPPFNFDIFTGVGAGVVAIRVG
ncbi:uncharacterized protein PGTG_00810 [Puccinia graminis f. sp. tritici CRL 75-36-700-3]|uniref:Uncharacterized protein n=1 Tax=Puccinia graminis f. sp. tritici (strain CRL 75-36-700-3 / race SCCL) TaxID=418459 RepID=E3JTX0_PUCGT|nr:uncharacterized protein PGTG_00810 [Puccinia graminis f. sp. tritici CRL 75-36-700-3]EFP75479.1 hypothetical protein PGTG_00810 [Puccinia graminis f. sp. tritici CRL 75-36-700-3]